MLHVSIVQRFRQGNPEQRSTLVLSVTNGDNGKSPGGSGLSNKQGRAEQDGKSRESQG